MALVTVLIYLAARVAAAPRPVDQAIGWLVIALMAWPLPTYLGHVVLRDLVWRPKVRAADGSSAVVSDKHDVTAGLDMRCVQNLVACMQTSK